jgi:hypothetical protein
MIAHSLGSNALPLPSPECMNDIRRCPLTNTTAGKERKLGRPSPRIGSWPAPLAAAVNNQYNLHVVQILVDVSQLLFIVHQPR